MFKYKIIATTGTKGKTSVVRMLDFLFYKNNKITLRVDTDGYYINMKQKQNFDDIVNFSWLYPTVAPGRFLYEFQKYKEGEGVAILETSIGCARAHGLGYNKHHIAIFTNVYEDHLDGKKIKTAKDILKEKAKFILQLYNNSYFIYNYDDVLVRKLRKLKRKSLKTIAFSLDFDLGFLKRKLKKERYIFMVKDNWIIKYDNKTKKIAKLLNLEKFEDLPVKYRPFLYNLLAVVAGAFAYGLKKKNLEILYKYKYSELGSRMTLFKVDEKFVLLDYAHEKYSIKNLADYIRDTGRKSIAILRLDYKRTFDLIKSTGYFLADYFDSIFIYDKVDGIHKKRASYRGELRKVGEVSRIFYNAIKEKRSINKNVHRYLLELKALDKALDKSSHGDVIVLIVNHLYEVLKYLNNKGAKRVSFQNLYVK